MSLQKPIQILFIFITYFFLLACSTSQKVTVGTTSGPIKVQSAYLVTHGGNSVDMDHHFQRDLTARKIAVTASEKEPQPLTQDLLVKYDDAWRWDLAMYLYKLDVTLYDKKGTLLATGQWNNSAFHTFPDANIIVTGLVTEMFQKLNIQTDEKNKSLP